jgi:ubiquinone/menaquinone biosynthesis C-methylase UbiE
VKPRVIETDQGIQGQFIVAMYDQMQRRFRDRGWIETAELVKRGITHGLALEVGPGPGYLGLEWLKRTQGTRLKGLDISPDMVALVERNAREYGLLERTEYHCGNAAKLPFGNAEFDAVFTNVSLHEWSDPRTILGEIARVLKPAGRVFISDLRRDISPALRWLLWLGTSPKEIRAGLISSLRASYTPQEVRELIAGTALEFCTVSSNPIGVNLFGVKRV